MQAYFVYITCKDLEQAKKIAQTLLQERLIACANIFPPMLSLFLWEGENCQAEEVLCLCKTSQKLYPEVEARVKQLHSYDTPCIVALPVIAGSAEFLEWVTNSTSTYQG